MDKLSERHGDEAEQSPTPERTTAAEQSPTLERTTAAEQSPTPERTTAAEQSPTPECTTAVQQSQTTRITTAAEPWHVAEITTAVESSQLPGVTTTVESSESPDIPTPAVAAVPDRMVIVGCAIFFLYLSFGILVYNVLKKDFSGLQTNPFIDGMYFAIVTLCTVGYGDIVPSTQSAKLFTIILVMIGFISLHLLHNHVLRYVTDILEELIKKKCSRKGRLYLHMLLVVLSIGIGCAFFCVLEDVDMLDSVYLAVISISTVGYGDKSFKTGLGRGFASIWILVSTTSLSGLLNHFGENKISKYEYAVGKLIETGRVSSVELNQILDEYEIIA